MACLPPPKELEINVDETATNEILKRFGEKKSIKKEKALQVNYKRTFVANLQAPIQSVNNGRSLVEADIGGNEAAQNAVVENGAEQAASESENVNVIEGPFIAETDNVVEEVQALEGFELPAGQQPQGLIPPQQPVAQQPPIGPVYQQGGGYGSGGYGGGYGGGGGSSIWCFSGDTMVRTSTGLEKRMNELTTNDWVMTANYSNVFFLIGQGLGVYKQ